MITKGKTLLSALGQLFVCVTVCVCMCVHAHINEQCSKLGAEDVAARAWLMTGLFVLSGQMDGLGKHVSDVTQSPSCPTDLLSLSLARSLFF